MYHSAIFDGCLRTCVRRWPYRETDEKMKEALKLAMDKSMRSTDKYGRMYVEISNISKAAVNPYYGSEIPNGEALGLDAETVYKLLRHPDELAKAAPTFNNIPLLDRHIPVTADAPSKEFIVGSTGTDCGFDEPFLRNSLVIWCANAIAGVNTKKQCELSSAYGYDADMTPGIYGGVAYDGIMRNIKGNHVALVESGRAGSDVIVGDSKLLEIPKMKVGKLSAKSKLLLAACLTAAVGPMLAQDAQIKDLTAIAGTVDSLKTAKDKQALVSAVKKHFGDKLAQDADLEGVVALLDALGEKEKDAVADTDVTMDTDDAELRQALIDGGISEDKVEGIMALCKGGAAKAPVTAEDEVDDAAKEDAKKKGAPMIDKPAMDAAIAKATADTVKRMNAIHQAVADVEPHIGKIAIAQDSAEIVYKLALDAANVDVTGVHPSAYKAMVGMLPKAGAVAQTRTVIAQDSAAGATGFGAMFPNANRMKGGV